jgi:hypothetical protein
MADAVICRVCRKSDPVLCYPDDHALAICPECCAKVVEHPDGESGHQFIYAEREHFCTYCGIDRACTDYEYEPMDGDVGISFPQREPGGRPGTPISELRGRPEYPGDPRYEAFKRIAKSWGYD